jgi:hypothetical protein
MLAAAALFVAVHWDRIPAGGKLGIVVALTAACIGAGLRLRRTLPATADVLFHLGALLVPVDVAAVGLHQHFDLDHLLLAEGLVCSAAYFLLSSLHRSVLLTWAADAAVVTAAVGIGRTTDVNTGVALAGAAVVAHLVGRRASAVRWAAAVGAGCLVGVSVGWAAVAAAVVLGRQAEQDDDVDQAFLAMAVAAVGVVSSWARSDLAGDMNVVVVAGAFLGVELIALAFGADPFWGKPVRWVAGLGEAASYAVTVPVTLGVSLFALFGGVPRSPVFVTASMLVAFGWMAAELRRPDRKGLLAGLAAPCVAVACMFVGTPTATLVGGLAGAALLTGIARWRSGTDATPVFTFGAMGLILVGVVGGSSVVHVGGAVVIAMVALWLMANLVDDVAAVLPRVAIAVPLTEAALLLSHESAVAVGLLAAVLFAIDAVRLDRPYLAIGSAMAMQLVVGELAAAAGLRTPDIGVALVVAAVVWAGLAAVMEERWRLPFFTATTAGAAFGLGMAIGDPRALSDAVALIGALVVGLAVASGEERLGHVGGVVTQLGIVGHLHAVGVSSPEAYIVPTALHFMVAGALVRHRSNGAVSSWWAYAPAPALLGGVALSARVDGGPAWHAVLAGAVGVAAMSLGGWFRQAGPLFTGTLLLVAVAVHESLPTLVGTPTWAWLAAGGTALLAMGVVLERADTSPAEAGRRVVDVMHERFS